MQARLLLERANGTTGPLADDVLVDSGVLVVLDVICNAGGVSVSYFGGEGLIVFYLGPGPNPASASQWCAKTWFLSKNVYRKRRPSSCRDARKAALKMDNAL